VAAVLACTSLQGQARFYTIVSEPIIPLRQTFQVQYIIEGATTVQQFAVPRFTDFTVQESFDLRDQPDSQRQHSVYTKVFILSPKRTGNFVIPGAGATIDGRPLRSNTAQVQVTQNSLSPFTPENNTEAIDLESESVLFPGEDMAAKVRKNFFFARRSQQNHLLCR